MYRTQIYGPKYATKIPIRCRTADYHVERFEPITKEYSLHRETVKRKLLTGGCTGSILIGVCTQGLRVLWTSHPRKYLPGFNSVSVNVHVESTKYKTL